MNETVRKVLEIAGADPEKPSPVINGIFLGYRLGDSERRRERQALIEFRKWAGVTARSRGDDDDLPLKPTLDVLFAYGEDAARAVLVAYREQLLTRDDLNVIEVNERLASLRWVFDMARKLEVVDWRLPADALPNVSEAETADATRRRRCISIPSELDDRLRAHIGESASSLIARAIGAELDRLETGTQRPRKGLREAAV